MSSAVTEVTKEFARPFRKLGKWAQTVLPHDGWRCIAVVDHGTPNHTCHMCEARDVRYVHWMEHDDQPEILKVGCDCAGRLEQEPKAAEERERVMKNRAQRRLKWLSRRWRVSLKGNPYLRTAGYRVIVWPKDAGWSFTVASEGADTRHEPTTFSTLGEAKLAAFDFIWPALSASDVSLAGRTMKFTCRPRSVATFDTGGNKVRNLLDQISPVGTPNHFSKKGHSTQLG